MFNPSVADRIQFSYFFPLIIDNANIIANYWTLLLQLAFITWNTSKIDRISPQSNVENLLKSFGTNKTREPHHGAEQHVPFISKVNMILTLYMSVRSNRS